MKLIDVMRVMKREAFIYIDYPEKDGVFQWSGIKDDFCNEECYMVTRNAFGCKVKRVEYFSDHGECPGIKITIEEGE